MTPEIQNLLERTLKSLAWMITDIKTRFDNTEINPGNYSQELLEAMRLQYDIEKKLSKRIYVMKSKKSNEEGKLKITIEEKGLKITVEDSALCPFRESLVRCRITNERCDIIDDFVPRCPLRDGNIVVETKTHIMPKPPEVP